MQKVLVGRTLVALLLVNCAAPAVAELKPVSRNSAILNNDGVKALNEMNFQLAIDKFREAVKANPGYVYARDNLAIAYNNYALKAEPNVAMACFHKALLLGPQNKTTRQNLREVFATLKRGNVNRAEDRIRFGDELLAKKDYVGAYVEYSEALRLKEDESTKKKLAEVPTTDVLFEVAKASPTTTNNGGYGSTDFGPYMANLQRSIKRSWFPPKGDETRRVVVVFKIDKTGGLSDLRLDRSSGVPLADTAALHAVTEAAPFAVLPKGSPEVVDIMFTFDYNVFGGKRSASAKTSEADRAEAVKLVEQAKLLVKKGDHKQAFTVFDNAVRKDPTNKDARELGITEGIINAKQAGSPEAVLDALCDLIKRCGPSDQYKLPLIDALKAVGKKADSFADIRAVASDAHTRGKQNTESVMLNLALPLAPTDDDQLAVKNELSTLYKRANAQTLISKWQWALDQRATAENYAGLGSAYEMRGDNDKAIALYEKALAVDPYHANAKALLVSLKERVSASMVQPPDQKKKKELPANTDEPAPKANDE